MKIIITGTASGIGQELALRLQNHNVVALTRQKLDLADISAVANYNLEMCDMLINCAATDVGGKIDFVNHATQQVVNIINTNVLSPMILSKRVLSINTNCKIVNITSTNVNRYYPNNLAYSLSKQALSDFGAMLKLDYPDLQYLEVRLGLTKTNFNHNRYRYNQERYSDVYTNRHLSVDHAVTKIVDVLFDSSVKMIEISP
jgi:short-subunit dehydrogenase